MNTRTRRRKITELIKAQGVYERLLYDVYLKMVTLFSEQGLPVSEIKIENLVITAFKIKDFSMWLCMYVSPRFKINVKYNNLEIEFEQHYQPDSEEWKKLRREDK